MWRSIFGTVIIEIRSADIGAMLEKLTRWNITVTDLQYIDDLTITLRVNREDYRRIEAALQGSGCQITVKRHKGIYWKAKDLLKRPVFTFGIVLYLLFVVTVPGRVFFVQIEGNTNVPDRRILEAAQECGIGFGAKRREVRSEKMKNALLEKIPQLQWAGINTNGCVAVISVRERQEEEKRPEVPTASIVAARDAIVRQVTVLRGTQLCKVGQAVKAGEILVSAYKDYGISLKLTGAQAEIYGQTERQLEVFAPASTLARTSETGREQKYSLIIGKKQINFFKGSGISHTSCVKMYKKTYLALPGGFVLPVALVKQEIIYYETQPVTCTDFSFLEEFSENYLVSQMASGRILQEESELATLEDVCRYFARYSCYELIGIAKDEEFIKQHE